MDTLSSLAASSTTAATQFKQTLSSTALSYKFYRPTPSNTPNFYNWLIWFLVICGIISGIEAFYQKLDYHNLDHHKLSYFRWALWLLYVVLVLVFLPLVIVVYMTRYFRGDLDWLVSGTNAGREEQEIELEEGVGSSA